MKAENNFLCLLYLVGSPKYLELPPNKNVNVFLKWELGYCVFYPKSLFQNANSSESFVCPISSVAPIPSYFSFLISLEAENWLLGFFFFSSSANISCHSFINLLCSSVILGMFLESVSPLAGYQDLMH